MSSIKEIRNKITSIYNIKKITKAMEVVAASKISKLYNLMISNYTYTNKIRTIIDNLVSNDIDFNSPFLKERKVKNIVCIVISTDHGLCGCLNINLFKKILNNIKLWSNQDIKINLAIIGSKGISFFSAFNTNIIMHTDILGNKPSFNKLFNLSDLIIQAFIKNEFDKILFANNKFINNITYVPTITQILPILNLKDKELINKNWSYLYEPDPITLLNALIPRYVKSKIYQGVIENLVSEQAARMLTMKSMTNNSDNVIKELHLFYNKVRQSNITQEINEIISGATTI